MKRVLLLLLIVAAAKTSSAQSDSSNIPNYIHLTAVARHSYSPYVIFSNTTIGVQAEIWQSASDSLFTTPTEIYCFYNTVKTNSFGEFSIDFTPTPLYTCSGTVTSVTSIPWSNGKMWYIIKFDSSGGTDLSPIDTGLIATTPYAFAARTAEQLVNVGTPPASGATLTWNGSAWVAGNNPWANYLLAEEQEPSTTQGGPSISGWQTRNIKTLVGSSGSAITLTDDTTITINQSGIYYVKASAPAVLSSGHTLAIVPSSGGAAFIQGTSENSGSSAYSDDLIITRSIAEGFITVTSPPLKFKLSHYITNALTVYGLGTASGAEEEVYSTVFVQKIQ